MADNDVRALPQDKKHYENLLKGPLVDLDKNTTFRTMPELKKDLEQRWQDAVEKQRTVT